MNTDKRLLAAAVVVGFLAGFLVSTMVGGSHFQLKESGVDGVLYKVDTRSGKTWLITPRGESPLE